MTPTSDAFELGPGGRAAVLCLHGLTGTPWEVRAPAEALASVGFRCVGPVLPGHVSRWEELAQTPRSAWVDAALEAFDNLAQGHDRVYVLGLSMGGLLALLVAARRPVAGAVIMAAPLRLSLYVEVGVRILHPFVSSVVRVPRIRDPQAREQHPGYRRMPLKAVRQFLALQREVESELPSVTGPAQLIYSHGDPTAPAWNAQRIRARLRSDQVEIIYLGDSGHVITVDREALQVREHVVAFLERTEGGVHN